MKALVEWVTRSMVDHPDAVDVREVDGPHGTVLELRVSPEDLGKVIGRGGRVIKAIRTLARAAATRSGKRVTVEIVRG
ncbi:MAG: KH domain-containing protein [Bacillati bacterium ANGP1]|uniref:RNA-binding protein KhpA n=1 Tax=Candidatus Segetimicrobium genomatis TaxID=2569760 RepID=A0A537M0Q1_9BACT|nr:MAG: KH domain-containing protein [Terrabacteria group bacterium ANGP1]TMJ13796.1 MAG: KH domain-containing protein [Terrabacteria group bacterium ANGP1]